jgi:hypothetical protein
MLHADRFVIPVTATDTDPTHFDCLTQIRICFRKDEPLSI